MRRCQHPSTSALTISLHLCPCSVQITVINEVSTTIMGGWVLQVRMDSEHRAACERLAAQQHSQP